MGWFIKDGNNLFTNGQVAFKVGQNTEGIDSTFYTLPSTSSSIYENSNIIDCDDEKLFYVKDTSGYINVVNLANLSLVTTISRSGVACVKVDKAGGRIFLSNYSSIAVIDYSDYSLITTLSLSNVSAIDFDIANNLIAFGANIYNYTTLASITTISNPQPARGVKFDGNSQIFFVFGSSSVSSLLVYDYSYSNVATLSTAQVGGTGRYRGLIIRDGYLGVQCSSGIRFLPLNDVTAGYNSSMNINANTNPYVHGMCYDNVYNRIFHANLTTSPSNVSNIYTHLFK